MLRLSLSLLALILCGTTAHAQSYVTYWWTPGVVYSYYYAPPAYYSCTPAPMIVPVPDAKKAEVPPRKDAAGERMPKITAAHSLGMDPSKTCRVGFWNLTGREVTLTIEGKSWTLPKNQVLNFQMERNFTWQVNGQLQHIERVPDGQASYEVLVKE